MFSFTTVNIVWKKHKCFLKGFHYFSLSAGCDYNGQIVPSGQPVGDPENRCETCICRQGNVECTAAVCEDLGDCRSPTILEGDCCPVCMDCGQYADGDVWTPTPCRRCSCQVCWGGGVGGEEGGNCCLVFMNCSQYTDTGDVRTLTHCRRCCCQVCWRGGRWGRGATATLCSWTAGSTLILMEMCGHLHLVVAALVRCVEEERVGGGGGGRRLLTCVHELQSVHWYWWRCVDTYLVVAALVRCVAGMGGGRWWGGLEGGFNDSCLVHMDCGQCVLMEMCGRQSIVIAAVVRCIVGVGVDVQLLCVSAWRGSLWQDPVSTNWLRTPLHTPRSLLSSVSRSVLVFQVIG